MANSTVTVSILGDANDLKRALGDADSALARFGDKAKSIGDKATSIGRSMSIGVTLPLVALGKVAFDELQQSAAASAQTAAAIKSTGGAANVTAKQVDEYAQSMLKRTGIDDESIKSGENVLLTFTKIRNEVGKGNDVFTKASTATLDLSVRLGKDMTSSALLVGKALNDPVKGVTALTRAGVQFTDQQKDQIKTLVESGDVLGAQKLILKELEVQVGGSAKAFGGSFAGQISKAKEELKNAGAAILTAFIPALKSIASIALDASQAFLSLPDGVQKAIVIAAGLVAAYGPAAYIFGSVAKGISGVISVLGALHTGFQLGAVKALELADSIKKVGVANALLTTAGLVGFVGVVVAAGVAIDRYLGGSEAGLFNFVKAAEKGTTAGKRFAESIIAGAKNAANPLEELRARLDTLRTSQAAVQRQYDAGNISIEEAVGAHRKYQIAIAAVKGAIGDQKTALDAAAAAEATHKQAVHDLASGTTDWANATEDAKSAILDLQNAVLAASGGELGLEQANLNLTDAQQAYTDALNEGDPKKIADAELNLRQARLSVASATLQAQDSQQKLLDVVKQGPDAVQAEINKLKDAQNQYGDTSGAIQDQIDKLFFLNLSINGLPDQKGVNIAVSVLGAAAVYDLLTTLQSLTADTHDVVVDVVGSERSFFK